MKRYGSTKNIFNYNIRNNNFVSQFEGISKIVVGVDNLDQLKALATSNLFFENISYPNIACNDERLINPSNWAVL